MSTNFYYQSGIPGGRSSEQRLVEGLIIEAIKIYGFDLFYLPKTTMNLDYLFQDDPTAIYENAIAIESYLENVDGFGGDGELMSKFGIQIRDTATFLMARSRWEDVIGLTHRNSLQLPNRPAEGDLLYMPLTKSYFEIKKVEATNPFFQLGKLYTYKLQCELWQYSSEELNTGVNEIDSMEDKRTMNISNFQLLTEAGDRIVLENSAFNEEDAGMLLWEGWSIDDQDPLADNSPLRDEALGILDFSEINPFGEVIRQNV